MKLKPKKSNKLFKIQKSYRGIMLAKEFPVR